MSPAITGIDLWHKGMHMAPRGGQPAPSVASLTRIELPATCQCGAPLAGRAIAAAGFVHNSGAATCCAECPGCQCWTAAP